MKTLMLSALAGVLAAAAGPAAAQDNFPSRPIQLMVAYPAGGSTDIGARIVAGMAEKAIGQPIVVINKGGAGGQVGWTEMSRQKPDGYYIGFINLPAFNTVNRPAPPEPVSISDTMPGPWPLLSHEFSDSRLFAPDQNA